MVLLNYHYITKGEILFTRTTNDTAINKEITINVPINLVWLAWTISERDSEWFATESDIEAKEGGAYELYFIHGNRENMNTNGSIITKPVDETELHFNLKGQYQFEALMNNENGLTNVKVSFDSINEDSTKVILEHTGFSDDSEDWNEAIKWHEMAWSGVLDSLKSALESGKGNVCCQP